MKLSRYSEFTAPSTVTASALEQFLTALEFKAKTLGFSPTSVLNLLFDTPERRAFAMRLGGGYYVEDERLCGAARLLQGQVDHHNTQAGSVSLVPVRAVVLAVTDAAGCESSFGFMQFPEYLADESGSPIMRLPKGDVWTLCSSLPTLCRPLEITP